MCKYTKKSLKERHRAGPVFVTHTISLFHQKLLKPSLTDSAISSFTICPFEQSLFGIKMASKVQYHEQPYHRILLTREIVMYLQSLRDRKAHQCMDYMLVIGIQMWVTADGLQGQQRGRGGTGWAGREDSGDAQGQLETCLHKRCKMEYSLSLGNVVYLYILKMKDRTYICSLLTDVRYLHFSLRRQHGM